MPEPIVQPLNPSAGFLFPSSFLLAGEAEIEALLPDGPSSAFPR